MQTVAPVDGNLMRGVGRWDLVALLINVVVGAGVLGLPAKSYALIGSYSIVGWILCTLIMGVIAACFAEVGSRFVETGGPYLYAHRAFGPGTGFVVGWLAWVSRLFSFATIANLAVTYATELMPPLAEAAPRAVTIVAVTTILTALLFAGVRCSTLVNNLLTACKLVLLVGFVLVCLPFIDPERLTSVPQLPAIPEWQAAMMLMTFAFLGIESAMITAGETKNPKYDVPFSLAAGLAVVALLYIAIQVACVGTLPGLATSQRPLVDAAHQVAGPLAAQLVNIGALVTMLGTLFAILLTGSRLPFALAEQGQLPVGLAAVHRRFRTPYVAILVTGICAGLLALYTSLLGALVVSTLTRLIGYATTCAALIVLRSHGQEVERAAFTLPGGVLVAIAGIAACGWLMLGSSSRELIVVSGIAVIGCVCWGLHAFWHAFARSPGLSRSR